MHFPTRHRWLLFGALLLATGGCFKLGRTQPTLQQYVLGGGAADTSSAPGGGTGGGLAIGVRRLDLATYLAIPAVVVRRGESRIVHSEYHRWAEDLAQGISRVLARNLAGEAGVRSVDVAPWSIGADHDYLLQLHVSRFEGIAPEDSAATAGSAHVRAGWEVLRRRGGVVLARGITEFREDGWRVDDYRTLVAMLDRGLGAVARDVAGCLARLGPVPAGSDGPTVSGATPPVPLACGSAAE